MPLRNRAALAFVVDFLQQLKRGTGSSTEPALPAAAARRRWPNGRSSSILILSPFPNPQLLLVLSSPLPPPPVLSVFSVPRPPLLLSPSFSPSSLPSTPTPSLCLPVLFPQCERTKPDARSPLSLPSYSRPAAALSFSPLSPLSPEHPLPLHRQRAPRRPFAGRRRRSPPLRECFREPSKSELKI